MKQWLGLGKDVLLMQFAHIFKVHEAGWHKCKRPQTTGLQPAFAHFTCSGGLFRTDKMGYLQANGQGIFPDLTKRG
jgi:hypothetical protein